MNRVLELSCVVCWKMGVPQEGRTFAHHCFDTSHRDDALTIPLCHMHHQGPLGFHTLGEREFNRRYRTDETHLIAETIKLLAR